MIFTAESWQKSRREKWNDMLELTDCWILTWSVSRQESTFRKVMETPFLWFGWIFVLQIYLKVHSDWNFRSCFLVLWIIPILFFQQLSLKEATCPFSLCHTSPLNSFTLHDPPLWSSIFYSLHSSYSISAIPLQLCLQATQPDLSLYSYSKNLILFILVKSSLLYL